MAIKTYPKASPDKLSEHFSVAEFSCHGQTCGCSETKIDDKLVAYLEQIREHFGARTYISSGYRCPTHNAAVGGASKSYHMRGQAADITVEGIAPAEVAKYAESIGILGIGLYESFVHVDTRTTKSYWYSSAQEYRSTFGGTPTTTETTAPAENVSRLDTLPMLKRGDKSDTVKALQILLIGYGYDLAAYGADGAFGGTTESAVKAFQSDNALGADGIVGAKTWAKLLGM